MLFFFFFFTSHGNGLVTTEARRNYLISEPNYHTINRNEKKQQQQQQQKTKQTQIHMNKLVYLGFLILELSKIVMFEFWYDYVKEKYGENAKLCYMDTDSFIVYIKTDDIFTANAEDVETRFENSNYELNRPSPKGKNDKVIGVIEDEIF